EAADALRWSIADSPYQNRLPRKRIEMELATRFDPTDLNSTQTKVAREIRARFSAATAAIKELDEEGLFGNGKAREEITLLIEAGGGQDEFVLKWAKKLNPAPVYRAFQSLFKKPEVGQWSEFGTKRVYQTTQLAITSNRRLIATASQHFGCV